MRLLLRKQFEVFAIKENGIKIWTLKIEVNGKKRLFDRIKLSNIQKMRRLYARFA